MALTININGTAHSVDVDGDTPLVLRDVLGMTGTKFGCGMALCGACTVHLDGVATRSCVTPVDSIGNAQITTIEAIGNTPIGASIQKAWLDHEVPQLCEMFSISDIWQLATSREVGAAARAGDRRRFDREIRHAAAFVDRQCVETLSGRFTELVQST
jgi:aerobic-type carbon monoxide dehydrogenase small subunit (CoxS/CutS family)